MSDPPNAYERGASFKSNPNKITSADFEGWVQERGIYFWGDFDSKYTPVLSGPYLMGKFRSTVKPAA